MKIADIKNYLSNYSENELKSIVLELYKAIPKKTKESKKIDSIIEDLSTYIDTKKIKKRPQELPDIECLSDEIEKFVNLVNMHYYVAPNRLIHEKEKSKWRFRVKRFYKELILCSQDIKNIEILSNLLEKLYNLLCYACEYIVFRTEDPFGAINIKQTDFFDKLLYFKYQVEKKEIFIKNAISLMYKNYLDRNTLYTELMDVIFNYIKTTDLLEMALEENNKLIQLEINNSLDKTNNYKSTYRVVENINNLTKFGFLCYIRLSEVDEAVNYFYKNYRYDDKEVKWYMLLTMLCKLGYNEIYIREYERAVNSKIKPRESLQKIYKLIKQK